MDGQAERLIVELFHQAHVSIWACDRNFRVVLWNRGAEEVYGYTAEEMIGRSYLDTFVDEAERDDSLQDCLRTIDAGKRDRNLLAYDKNAAGQVKYMLTNCFRIIDPATGDRFQAEIGVEISDLELRKDEHRSLRELGIVRRESRKIALQRERDDGILRVGRVIDEVRYVRDRMLRDLEDFAKTSTDRNRTHVRNVYTAQVERVERVHKFVLLELQNIELRCRVAETPEDVRAGMAELGDNPRVWTDRVRQAESDRGAE